MRKLTAANLAALAGIAHGFFTRDGGVSEGIYASLNCGLGSRDHPDAVIENRARVAAALGASQAGVVTLYQVHSATAVVAEGPIGREDLPRADAVVTRARGLAVGALAADCAPVLFADAEARVVAAAHAGWRGAVGGVLEATIAQMEKEGAARHRIHAAVGPCIGPQAYEVGPEFEAEFLRHDAGNAVFFHKPAPGARAHFDLPGYVAARLRSAAVASVEHQAPCTFESDSNLFSYRRSQARREGDYGRQISAIVLQ